MAFAVSLVTTRSPLSLSHLVTSHQEAFQNIPVYQSPNQHIPSRITSKNGSRIRAPGWSLEGKVAVVTGFRQVNRITRTAIVASLNMSKKGRGIGKEMALELARTWCQGRRETTPTAPEAAEKVVPEIKAMGSDAIAVKANVSNVAETTRLMDEVVAPLRQAPTSAAPTLVLSLSAISKMSPRRSMTVS